jgi:hypothetical protein
MINTMHKQSRLLTRAALFVHDKHRALGEMKMNDETTRKNLVFRLFNGDVPLVKTFWLYGVLVNFILNLIAFSYPIFAHHPSTLFLNIFLVVAVCYLIFIWISIVRSALKYQGRKIWTVLAITVVALGVINLAYSVIQGYRESKEIMAQWDNITKKLPEMLDSDTRLESVTVGGNDLFYHLTLVNQTKDTMDMTKFDNETKAKVIASACKQPETRQFLDDNFNLIYIYQDKDGNAVGKFFITNLDCGNAVE